MELEELCVFKLDGPVSYPLGSEKRSSIEHHVAADVAAYEKQPTFKWAKRPDEEIVRINIDPFVLELIFSVRTVELYGFAPTWAKLLFTKARQEQLAATAENVLTKTGFQITRFAASKPETSRGWRRDKTQA